MLIVSLKQHFPARWPEWFMSAFTVAWGIYVALHPELFTQDATRQTLSGMAAMSGDFPPAALWGLSAVVLGMIRGAALFINGAYTRTPLIRLIMSFLSAFVWTQVYVGLWKSGVPNMDLIVYGAMVGMDIVSAYRATTDTMFAEKMRRDLKQERRRDERSYFA